MSERLLLDQRVRSAYSASADAATAVEELISAFGDVDAAAVLFFNSPSLDGTTIANRLIREYGPAPVIGCTTAGEFNERRNSTGGVSAVVLPSGIVRRAVASMADLSDIDGGLATSIRHIEDRLGVVLRDADPFRYVGLVLMDGTHGSEERVNEVLGNHAPLMSFVGGSAGDDLQFTKTHVFCGETVSDNAAALLVLECAVPFTVVKTCSFRPSGRRFVITDADLDQRIVWELDGRPATEVYAEATGYAVDELADKAFMLHPLGLMIDDEPWIRSPYQVVDGRGIKFFCQILPGMEVDLMNSTDLIGDTRRSIREAVEDLGGSAAGAVMFNCILRRLEMDQKDLGDEFVSALGGIPASGFHTYGESWLGHINQTLTAVVFGTN
jgi:hypothetical protein